MSARLRIAFKTFGCRANSVDTDVLFLEAKKRGYHLVNETDIADAYVINTCTVTDQADREARRQINRFKRRNPNALIGVVGCYAQVAKDELLRISAADFVVGTGDKIRILDLIDRGGDLQRDQVQANTGFLVEEFRGSRNARANIKIQDGCNFKCSFCIIPQARGKSRSLPLDVVLKQINDAYEQGFNEIILTGIHLAHYGWDQETNLLELLKATLKKDRGPRIRLSTLDPFEIPDDLISMLGNEERLCPHFHIALQSGSDRILAGMRRIYKAEKFIGVTQRIAKQKWDTFIGVDVIVGFPGEGDAEFQRTVSCLQKSPWAKLHVFPFSERRATVAERLEGKIDRAEIDNRARKLLELSTRRYLAFLENNIGTERDVLLEQRSSKRTNVWLGHTENYLPTFSEWGEGAGKTILRARISAVENDRVWASPVVAPDMGFVTSPKP